MLVLEKIPLLAHAGVYVITLYKVLFYCDRTFKSYGLYTSSKKRKVLDKNKLYHTNSKYE